MIEHISDTARWVAHYRAEESERPDAVFRDPFARRLAGPKGAAIARGARRGSSMAWAMVVRTVAFDEMLLDCIGRGATRIVNLAAGLDSRPWRLALPPDLSWVDVDLPDILDYKLDVLRDAVPACRYEAVRADLTSAAERQATFATLAGDPAPTVVLTEGLLVYLTPEDVGSLARAVHAIPGGRWWLIDIVHPRLLQWMDRSWGQAVQQAQAPFRFAPESGTRFYEAFGWREAEFRSATDEARRIGREMRLMWLYRLFSVLASKEKKEMYRRFSGFVRLDRL